MSKHMIFKQRLISIISTTVSLVCLTLPIQLAANDISATDVNFDEAALFANTPTATAEDAAVLFADASAVDNSELSEVRGTFTEDGAQAVGLAVLEANVLHVSANNAVTGNNTVTNDAFGSAQGVVSLIQNSGNNVVIQSATIVNMTMK